nr:beta family protein [Amycolatopsis sp. SID8362]
MRTKGGELTALRAISGPEQVRQVQPLLQFDPRGSAPASQLDAVEAAIRNLRQLGRRVMLDASEVAHLPAFGHGPTGPLGQLADRLSDPVDLLDAIAPSTFVPVVRSDADLQSAAALGRLCHELAAGGALRIRPATAARATIEQIIEQLALDTGEIDLIVDLQYVPEVTAARVDEAAAILSALAELGEFRTTSLLSGSIPRTLARTSTWEQPRNEEVLWDQLSQNGATELRLGDYGTIHPIPSEGFGSKHVNLKYTCPEHWFYSRERMPEPSDQAMDSPRARTFRIVCRNLVESDSFAGPEFSWGDREILETAAGQGQGSGSSSKPVALAISHHLAYLAGRRAA